MFEVQARPRPEAVVAAGNPYAAAAMGPVEVADQMRELNPVDAKPRSMEVEASSRVCPGTFLGVAEAEEIWVMRWTAMLCWHWQALETKPMSQQQQLAFQRVEPGP